MTLRADTRAILTADGWSQTAYGAEVGVREQTIYQWQRGAALPRELSMMMPIRAYASRSSVPLLAATPPRSSGQWPKVSA